MRAGSRSAKRISGFHIKEPYAKIHTGAALARRSTTQPGIGSIG